MPKEKVDLPLAVFAVLIVVLSVGCLVAGFLVNPETGEVWLPEGKPAFLAIIVAFLYGMSGYLKNTQPEDFEPVKFIISLIIALITSIVMFEFGIGYLEASHLVTNVCVTTGAVVLIENWLKVLIRQVTPSS